MAASTADEGTEGEHHARPKGLFRSRAPAGQEPARERRSRGEPDATAATGQGIDEARKRKRPAARTRERPSSGRYAGKRRLGARMAARTRGGPTTSSWPREQSGHRNTRKAAPRGIGAPPPPLPSASLRVRARLHALGAERQSEPDVRAPILGRLARDEKPDRARAPGWKRDRAPFALQDCREDRPAGHHRP